MRTLMVAAVLGFCAAAAAQTPAFHLVGVPQGAYGSAAYAITSNGGMAVGSPGFIWTEASGRYDFGMEPGMPAVTAPRAVSSMAGVVAGFMQATLGANDRAFRWTGSGLPQDLGVLPGALSSRANGLSGDGAVVVGHCDGIINSAIVTTAFRWTEQSGMQPLPHLRPGSTWSVTRATNISRDGLTIVGRSQRAGNSSHPMEAFKWTQAGGMVALPGLPGASIGWEEANAVNPNGSVIVGNAVGSDGRNRMVRWTSAGVQDLGLLPGHLSSIARAVSDSGLVVAGHSSGPHELTASLWTPSTGHVSLAGYLVSLGVAVPSGWKLIETHAVSGNGLTFAGEAMSSTGMRQGFVATVPAPSGAILLLGTLLLMRRRIR